MMERSEGPAAIRTLLPAHRPVVLLPRQHPQRDVASIPACCARHKTITSSWKCRPRNRGNRFFRTPPTLPACSRALRHYRQKHPPAYCVRISDRHGRTNSHNDRSFGHLPSRSVPLQIPTHFRPEDECWATRANPPHFRYSFEWNYVSV